MGNKARYHNLSLYRLIASIAIIIYHIFYLIVPKNIPYEMLLSSGVQGLTLLSGMLYATKQIKDNKSFYKNNAFKILIPAGIAILMMVVWNLIAWLIAPFRFDGFLSTFYSLRAYNQTLQIQIGNFWYVPMILVCYFLTPFLQKARNTKGICFSKILIITAILIELFVTIKFYAPNMIIAYVVGYLIGTYKFEEHVNPTAKGLFNRLAIYTCLTFLFFALYYFSIESGNLSNPNSFIRMTTQALQRYSHTFIGMSTFLLIISGTSHLNKMQKEPKILKFSDKYSYAFYLFNQAFMVGAMNVAGFANNIFLQTLIVFAFTLAYAVLATNITTPILDLILKKKKNQ